MSLEGKAAIITGGAQGLGKAFAKQLLKRGAQVALLDKNEAVGQATMSELNAEFGKDKVIFYKCDVTDKDNLNETFQSAKSHWGKLDIVINNAGIIEEEEWEKAVQVNLSAVIRGTYLAIDLMGTHKGGDGGVIINVASIAGIIPFNMMPVYCGTKGAVIQFSLACVSTSVLLQTKGIRINVLAPSFADTAIVKKPKDEAGRQFMQKVTEKAGGTMTPEYVATNMMEMIEDPTKNGAVMKLSKAHGTSYHTFTPGLEGVSSL